MQLISEYFPVILFENYFIPTIKEKEFLINHIIKEKEKYNNNFGANNVKVNIDYNNFFNRLYEKFLHTSKNILNSFTISPDNSKQPWTYCTNQYDNANVWHNHINTSTINSVYYLQIPNCGGNQLEMEYNDKILEFFPRENDFIIFPNFLNHAPRKPHCAEYRISINLEITCNENYESVFKNFL